MSVPAEEMRPRRVPVARPAAQMLALPAPPPAPVPGVPPTTVVPPRADTVMVDRAGTASVSNVQPRTAAPATAPAPAARPNVLYTSPGGQAADFLRAPSNPTRLPPGVTGPIGPTPVVNPALSPNTAAASMGAPPAAAATPAPAARAPAASMAEAAGRATRTATNAAGTAARMGAAPVQTTPGRVLPRTAPGQMGGTGALLATTGLLSAAQSAGTPSEQYAQRTGIAGGTLPRDLANRALGTMSDLGAAIADPLIGVGNAAGRVVQAVWPGAPAALTQQAPTLRSRFADAQNPQPVAPSAAATMAAPPAPESAVVTGPFTTPGAAPAATFDNVRGAAAGPQDAVIGSYTDANGRTVQMTAGDAQRRAGALPTASGPVATSGDNFAFATGPRDAAAALGAPAQQQQRREPGFVMPRDNQRATLERIDKTIADIGPMDRRGRRSAVADLLGLRAKIEGGTLDRESGDQRAAAELGQRTAASELAADVDREQIAASTANQRRQNTQTVTGADGTTYAVEGTTLTPLTTQDGQPFKAATKQDTTVQDLAAKLLQESMASGTVTDPQQAVQQAVATAQALTSQLAGGGQQPAAPSREQFMSAARAANPDWTDAQLAAEYQRRYSTGP